MTLENEVKAGILTDEDRKVLLDPEGLRVDRYDQPPTAAERPVKRRFGLGRRKPGVVEKEERRSIYEAKRVIFGLIGSILSTAGIATGLYFLSGGYFREKYAQKFRIEDKALSNVWLLDKDDPYHQGGSRILAVLEGSKVKGVDYDDRDTWGLRRGIGEKIIGSKGGNIFGEKAGALVGWTEALLTKDGRSKLVDKAKELHQGEKGIEYFQSKVGDRGLTWDEALGILRDPYFGFQEPYLRILTELRKEYLTGDGQLREVIESAKKVSQASKGEAKQVSQLSKRLERLAWRETKVAKIHKAESVLDTMGILDHVDAETTVAIAETLPYDLTSEQLVATVAEIWPDLPNIPRPPQLEGVDSLVTVFAITTALFANQAPRLRDWGEKQLEKLAGKIPSLQRFIASDKSKEG